MRGRRRGRNRPSPPSPSTQESSGSAGSQGSVALAEDSPVDEQPRDEPPEVASSDHAGDEAHSPAPVDAPAPSEESSAEGATDEVGPTDGLAEAGVTMSADSTAPTVEAVGPADEDTAAGSGPTSSTGVSDAPSEAAADEPAPATPGRVAQAASGNPLPRVLAVANQKGGVGKTTTSVNLGAALAELGFRVLVIDLDPQGNATTGLGIDARNFELSMYDVLMRDCSLEDCVEPTSMKNLFVAPATIALAGAEIELVPAFSRELKLKRAIESVIDDFDYVLIDCPPSLGLITVNALAAASEVLVPIQCEYYALEGLSQLMRNVHLVASNLNPRLDISTIVLTMYDARTKLADQVATEVRDHFGSKVCRIVIPRTVRLSEAPSFGQPITAFDPASRGAIAYRELAKEVSGGAS